MTCLGSSVAVLPDLLNSVKFFFRDDCFLCVWYNHLVLKNVDTCFLVPYGFGVILEIDGTSCIVPVFKNAFNRSLVPPKDQPIPDEACFYL